MSDKSNICPKCGGIMVEQFDYMPHPTNPTITLAVPNGTYDCFHCKKRQREEKANERD